MNREDLIKKLREKGYKITPQRLAIFDLINDNKDHPSAEEIHEKLSKNFPTMSLSTVYQVLNLFQELNLITELKVDKRGSRFETDPTPHLNIICPKCGRVEDYQSETINSFWKQIEKEISFEPLSQRIGVLRYCKDCIEFLK